jgi:long-chain acyl-CoA synthetase
MTITMLSPDDHRLVDAPELEKRYASAGRIRKDIEIAILDENDQVLGDEQIGEIALRGAVVMKGYWNLPEATAEVFKNNWYHTGDLGKRDRDGYYYLLDRKKEMIISGGANIYPREVEEVLLTHPGVLEVAVIGVPDRLWGESVVAIVRKRYFIVGVGQKCSWSSYHPLLLITKKGVKRFRISEYWLSG